MKWLGQSGFEIKAEGKITLVDPFLTDNPKAPISPKDIKEADLICVTHDHMDHLGDSINLAKRTGATFVSIFELGNYAENQGVENTVRMNMGATLDVKGVKVSMVQAFHSSQRGSPCGFVLDFGEERIYHAGDTSLFGDMKLIGEYYEPEIACIPIGGYYTTGPREAAIATSLIKPEIVVPMHYGTFPEIQQDPNEFAKLVESSVESVEVNILEPGEKFTF
ncbi:metal-dependent hydrolase [candidate division MSBL1 archaeon SCGC-AAA833F18]|uniref:UPF0173 metal-dependent hydrolase AKJ35_01360 n=1 Tax=candidate division MSBL1 archaeon SCGC-AAA833F18 TaxID=1698257 RepID=A0A133VRP1_9EURY|nr:metal-dependent hydrolase [candidate division MSBL1 archaeon SCGC-AAA833F18]